MAKRSEFVMFVHALYIEKSVVGKCLQVEGFPIQVGTE